MFSKWVFTAPRPTSHHPPDFKLMAAQLHNSSEKSIPKVAKELAKASEHLRWENSIIKHLKEVLREMPGFFAREDGIG